MKPGFGICQKDPLKEGLELNSGLFRRQTPDKAKTRLLISLTVLGLVFILIICGVAAVLLTRENNGGGSSLPSGDSSGGSNTPVVNRTAGYINVVDCGASPSDGKDDTEAFRQAASFGQGLYVPAGEYHLSGTVELNGQDVVGEGMEITSIQGVSDETLFRLVGNCRLVEMSLSYTDGTAGQGEKTAVRIASGKGGELSPSVKNVQFDQIGTAVFVESGVTNGVRLEDLTISNFGYAGVVFDGSGHRGAILRSVFAEKALNGACYGVALQGDEGTLLEQVTLSGCQVKQGVRFDGSAGFSVKTVQFLDVQSDALMGGDKAAGRIGSVFIRASEGDMLDFTNSLGGEINPEYTVVR